MKPRLKLHAKGGVTLIRAGTSHQDVFEVRQRIKSHYVWLTRFASFIGCSYQQANQALTTHGLKSAGKTSEVRQMLGLKSQPSPMSTALVAHAAIRRTRRGPDLVLSAHA